MNRHRAFILLIAYLAGCTTLRRGVIGLMPSANAKQADIELTSPELAPLEAPKTKADAIRLKRIASGFDGITDVQFFPGESHRAVVLQKDGKAFITNFKDNSKQALFTVAVDTTSEMGLLGFTFHPQFSKNKKFYVHHTPRSDLSRVTEWQWIDPPTASSKITSKELRVILEVAQPYQNHNGGSLVFGPDNHLYVGFGDGGWRGDPENRAQNKKSLLGKMLRINVDRNPIEPEIFALGLRNPWKYSFDSKSRLIAGDVGQDKWEEITFVENGANLGWRAYEGSHCYEPGRDCKKIVPNHLGPIAEYDHSLGASVTGGFEYIGSKILELKSRYLFGDFVSGRIWSITLPDKTPPQPVAGKDFRFHGKWNILISTFARDAAGEIYVADYSRGNIYQIEPDIN